MLKDVKVQVVKGVVGSCINIEKVHWGVFLWDEHFSIFWKGQTQRGWMKEIKDGSSAKDR